MDSVVGIKRLNPETGTLFKYGDKDQRGWFFNHYRMSRIKKSGQYCEVWNSPKSWEKIHKGIYSTRYTNVKRRKSNGIIGKKRINPKTQKIFKFGDFLNNKYFLGYNMEYIRLDGFFQEYWGNYETLHRFRVKNICMNARYRSKKNNKKCDLTVDYLIDIFPKDFICPALKIKMVWGTFDSDGKKHRYHPSLDRIDPNLGYNKGNVVFISLKANSIKNDANSDEILAVGNWLKEMEKQNG